LTVVQPAAEPHPAPLIPDYELVRLIGRGGYGDVWLARGVTGVFRAIKVIWRNRFSDPEPYAREFEGITRFAAISLQETSQLALLHAGRSLTQGFFYYVMELADDAALGREIDPARYVPLTLGELRSRRGRLPADEVVGFGVGLARALASLHANGLVHRDIKPSNIVVVGGVPKLADVGLVAAASAGLAFVGTEGFVPPEGAGTPAADVFSLGMVLYELATGLDGRHYPRLPPHLSGWPDRRALLELNEVLVRACEPTPAARCPDASTLFGELLLLQAGKSVRRLRTAERRAARKLRVSVALARLF
jgi:serine/threonine protein kinase